MSTEGPGTERDSHYTLTMFIDSEQHEDIKQGILLLCAEVRSLGMYGTHIRIDPGPGLVALTNDAELKRLGIILHISRHKNKNKNLVAERVIEELGLEILHISPEGEPISNLTLVLPTANMNSSIRQDGLSSRELWTQRD